MTMKLGSLFDGSGTAPVAAAMLGWEPVWASEIEPYPIAVTKARFPNMKHLGDITEINGAEIEPVDVIVGGSPCQDLSVAGKQAGLENGTRSNMFYEMTRIIREMRGATNGKYPRFVVWENVPGAFSSNKGRDFLSVVEAFCALADNDAHIPRPTEDKTGRLIWKNAGTVLGDGWSFAWRILDAQYWGVPQRRRRIFLVADFRSERAGAVLFEPEGLRRNSAKGGEAREGIAADVKGGVDGSCCGSVVAWTYRGRENGCNIEYQTDVAYALRNPTGGGSQANICYPVGVKCMNPWDCQSKRIFEVDGIYPTLPAMDGGGANNQAVIYPIHDKATRNRGGGQTRNNDGAGNGLGVGRSDDPMYTLTAADRHAVAYDARGNGNGDVAATITGDRENRVTDYTNLAVFGVDARNGALNEDLSPTMQAKSSGGQSLNCMPPVLYTQERIGQYQEGRSACTQLARQHKSATDLVVHKARRYIVRRLTPTECARLQGFPDWWVDGIAVPNPTDEDIAFWAEVWETHRKVMNPEGKPKTHKQIAAWLRNPGSDSNEYKMWGNGMALPCMVYVLGGIDRFAKE